jgi:hypothetical protein
MQVGIKYGIRLTTHTLTVIKIKVSIFRANNAVFSLLVVKSRTHGASSQTLKIPIFIDNSISSPSASYPKIVSQIRISGEFGWAGIISTDKIIASYTLSSREAEKWCWVLACLANIVDYVWLGSWAYAGGIGFFYGLHFGSISSQSIDLSLDNVCPTSINIGDIINSNTLPMCAVIDGMGWAKLATKSVQIKYSSNFDTHDALIS